MRADTLSHVTPWKTRLQSRVREAAYGLSQRGREVSASCVGEAALPVQIIGTELIDSYIWVWL
jgi:hypothetical protein